MSGDPFSVAGKRILVTGGTRGIGGEISKQLARGGAEVIAGYARNDDAAQALVADLERDGARVRLCRADVTTDGGKQRVLDAVGAGTLDGLVHCAATGVHRPIDALTVRHWDFTFALNLRAFFELVQATLPQMATGSTIVGVSSQGAVQAIPQYALVGATKGGLEALCRHLAVELAPRDIRVNVLSPGTVITEAWDALPDKDARLQEAVERAPRKRLTTPQEVAAAALFLCSDASAGVTGHTLVVDGGQRIRG